MNGGMKRSRGDRLDSGQRNVSIILRHGESTISVDRESRWGSMAGSPQAWISGED
jgi:hypothetical protein